MAGPKKSDILDANSRVLLNIEIFIFGGFCFFGPILPSILGLLILKSLAVFHRSGSKKSFYLKVVTSWHKEIVIERCDFVHDLPKHAVSDNQQFGQGFSIIRSYS